MSIRSFVARLKYAVVNARRSKKDYKKNGIVRLPNGSVIVNPRKHLSDFGLSVVESDDEYYEY